MTRSREFNHAADDSPRSGSTKQTWPVVWCAVTVALVAATTYFVLH
jgi:hypothetical protein